LRRKLAALDAAGWGFDETGSGSEYDHSTIQRELDELETEFKALPPRTELFNASLDALVDVFNNASHELWSETVSVIIDRMHIKRGAASGNANELLLNEFHSANGVIRAGLLVSYPTSELLPRKKFLSSAGAYL